MARRTFNVDGERWEVSPAGRITVYGRDEFGLVFETGDGPDRVRRVTRYSPLGARRWEASLNELSAVRCVSFRIRIALGSAAAAVRPAASA